METSELKNEMKEKIRFGILGTADIAEKMIVPAVKTLHNCEVTAVASRSEEKAKQFASGFDIPKYYGSYEELLADPEIDAVYNPLPVSLHPEWSIKSALAGKHVLCEKPLVASSGEAERMVEVFEERDLMLAEALMYRYHPLTLKFLEMIKEGAVGKPVSIQSDFHTLITDPDDIRLKKETGGGALLDLGVYCVSIIRNIAGEEPQDVKSFAEFNDRGVDVSFSGILKFPSGITGNFSCSLISGFSCGYSVVGTEGKLLVDRGGMVPRPGESFKIKHWKGEEYEEIVVPAANHYALMIEDFSNSLLYGHPLKFGMQDTINNLKTIDKLMEASKT